MPIYGNPLTTTEIRYMIQQTREQVLAEFSDIPMGEDTPRPRVHLMADEIVRLRGRLAAVAAAEQEASA